MLSGLEILNQAIDILEGSESDDSFNWFNSDMFTSDLANGDTENSFTSFDKGCIKTSSPDLDQSFENRNFSDFSEHKEHILLKKTSFGGYGGSTSHDGGKLSEGVFRPAIFKTLSDQYSSTQPNKSTGRPISNQMKCKFLLHESLEDAINFLNKTGTVNVPSVRDMMFTDCDVGSILCDIYEVDQIYFIKSFRSGNGKTSRIEVNPNCKNCPIKLWKKKFCFPRYKSGMKLHLIKGSDGQR
ncbi:hypothetical protein CLIB1444_09S01068 [[Candida] jaroonii]|uniref:Uncharacterized protein n=1 Tax=[Candida] jaroonii TaxID=467808 RepID=A0ACA9YBJ3_9ASCO|nr:hypothetical protein CLIB1444_09S01068 [[Candida] jaroonii]